MSTAEFSGVGWCFPPNFKSVESGPSMATDEVLIEQAIHILLNTLLEERVLHPNYGSRLDSFLFSSADPFVLADVKEEIANAIMLNEFRVSLKEINFDSQNIYEGIIKIELNYLIKSTNNLENMVFPYYLDRQ